MKDQIEEALLQIDPTALPGTKGFLTNYQSVCSQVIKDLSVEEKERCDQLLQEWNKHGPDDAVKAQ
jgi:hypothetical protein